MTTEPQADIVERLARTIPVVDGTGRVVDGLVNPDGREAAAEIAADQTPRNCMRCDEPAKRWLCDRCAAEEIEDLEAEEDGCPEFEFDCGMLPDGTCMLAGTEECDWECPYHD